MQKMIYFWMLASVPVWATQSIGLNELKPVVPQSHSHSYPKIKLIELRDAKLESVLKLIHEQSGLKSQIKKDLNLDLSLRLENTTWDNLLKIIVGQVSP